MPNHATAFQPFLPGQVEVVPSGVTAEDLAAVESWLHGRPGTTQAAYRRDIRWFLRFLQKPLRTCALRDLQEYADSLTVAPATKARYLSTVKSLMTFLHRLGYLPINVGIGLRLPRKKDTLAERILDEEEVQRMLALEPNPRNHALLRLLYSSGIRRAELVGLTWKDLQARTINGQDSGQITVFGKGGKTRTILLTPKTWAELRALRKGAGLDAPMFRSRQGGGALCLAQVNNIVEAAAKRAGIEKNVSPHWLRHAHASHALNNGATISLVQMTLGHASIQTTGRYLHARPGESSSQYIKV